MFKVGDLVEYYKEPTEKDWKGVGEVRINFKLGDKLVVIGKGSEKTGSIVVKKNGYFYPKECFRLVSEREPEFIFHI